MAIRTDRAISGTLRGLSLRRRDLLRGGLGLAVSATVGGLAVDPDRYAVPPPEPEEPPEDAAPPEEPPAQEPEPEEPPEDAAPPEDEEPPEEEPEPTMFRVGDSGDGVLSLQQQLGDAGYWCGKPDGGFGHLTEQAVFAVQKANGLYRDGVAGPKTLAAVASGFVPAAANGGDLFEVHLDSQLLLVVRGGATTMVFNTSTGNGEPYTFEGRNYTAVTPTGDFAVWYTDGSGWRDGELGELYRPMFYSGNYAVHGSNSIPPFPASHGCCRISVAAMDMVWATGLLAMGSRVVVR